MSNFPKPNFKVIDFRVLVKPKPIETKYAGVIELVEDTVEDEENAVEVGVVVGMGKGVGKYNEKQHNIPLEYGIGDVVCFQKFHGKKWQDHITGEKYIILNEDDIHGILLNYDNSIFYKRGDK